MSGDVGVLWRNYVDPIDSTVGFANTGYNRPNGLCSVIVQGQERTDVRYIGDPMPPLSSVNVYEVGDGLWVCDGPIGDGDNRVVVHDEFGVVNDTGTVMDSDERWSTFGSTTHIQGSTGQSPNIGVVDFRTGAVNSESGGFEKDDDILTLDRPYWCSFRFAPGDTDNRRYGIGMASAANTDGMQFRYDSGAGPDYFVRLHNATVATDFTIPGTYAATRDQWIVVDMVLAADEFGAVWLNGEGPYFTTTGVPAANTTTSVRAFLVNLTAAARVGSLDWMHVETMPSATRPDLVGDPGDELAQPLIAA